LARSLLRAPSKRSLTQSETQGARPSSPGRTTRRALIVSKKPSTSSVMPPSASSTCKVICRRSIRQISNASTRPWSPHHPMSTSPRWLPRFGTRPKRPTRTSSKPWWRLHRRARRDVRSISRARLCRMAMRRVTTTSGSTPIADRRWIPLGVDTPAHLAEARQILSTKSNY